MSRTRLTGIRLPLAALMGFVFFAAGCSDDASTPLGNGDADIAGEESLDTLDLDAEYGDLSFEDEAPAFGDDDLLAAASFESQAALSEDDEDSLADEDPEIMRTPVRRTFVRIAWGRLDGRFDPSAERPDYPIVDWSGSLSVTEGAVAVKRTILFERPSDHLLRRESRQVVAWQSKTAPHFDGILVSVLSREQDGVAPGQLTLDLPQLDVTLDIDTLDGLDRMVEVDDSGNAVSITAMVFDPRGCAAGFTAGFWRSIEDRPETEAVEMGGFRGRFVGENGITHGYLMGFYGLSSDGDRVMIGKYVGANGRTRGLIRGVWTPGADDRMGSFEARWAARNGQHMGTLVGRYAANGEDQIGDGFFEGRYREICRTDAR